MNFVKTALLITASAVCSIVSAQDIKDTIRGQSEEVVVTGQYAPQSLRKSVYQVRVINAERIRLRGAANVQQVLNNELGFRFSNDLALGTTDVQLMGMSGRNVKILLDGVPMLDRGDTRESLNQIDVNSIERIEIVEGPMSVSYGSDALAGVINIITQKSVNRVSVTAKMQEETVGSEYYPFGSKGLHTQMIGMNGSIDKWTYSFGANHNVFEGYGGDEYGRAKRWRPKEQWLGHARMGYRNEHITLYYRVDGLHETISNRGAVNYDIYRSTDQFFITQRLMHQLQNQWRMNAKMDVSSIFSFTNYQRRTQTYKHNFRTGTDELATERATQDISKFNGFVFRNTVGYRASTKLSLQAGLDINYEKATGARIKGEPAITDYALFVSTEIKPADKVNIRPGLRFIKNSVYAAPPVIPSLNTKFVLSKQLDLRLSYAYGFRSPALRELYFNFIDASHIIVGNPNLKAESSNSFSGSVSWIKPTQGEAGITSVLSGFYNLFNNLISYGVLASSPDTTRTINVDRFKTTGTTLETKLNYKNVNTTLGLSYIGRYNALSDNGAYKSLPEFVWSPEMNANIMYTVKKIKTTVGLFYKYTGKRPGYQLSRNAATGQEEVRLVEIGDFQWADLTLTKPLLSYFTLIAGVKNIFNVIDLTNSGLVSGGAHGSSGPVPMSYGRSYFLSVSFQWNKN